jgi:hypothetical protein
LFLIIHFIQQMQPQQQRLARYPFVLLCRHPEIAHIHITKKIKKKIERRCFCIKIEWFCRSTSSSGTTTVFTCATITVMSSILPPTVTKSGTNELTDLASVSKEHGILKELMHAY